MTPAALHELLRCPFCGAPLTLEGGGAIAACECCAYPIVDGIPYMRTGDAATQALAALGRGQAVAARNALLGLDERAGDALEQAGASGRLTFRAALAMFPATPEADYLLHRFTDPTFLVARALVRGLSQRVAGSSRPVLDVGGGAGHLSRVLLDVFPGAGVVLADVAFWKLWLARRFVAPHVEAVCCDANAPLPFARDTFAFAACSDAFHYIWSRRLFAEELQRVVGDSGTVLLAHLHNLLCDNVSAGMPLSPAAYRRLFERCDVGLFAETTLSTGLPEPDRVDLSDPRTPDDLAHEHALVLVATGTAGLWRRYELAPRRVTGSIAVNPLYVRDEAGESLYRLQFPSDLYEMEYGSAMSYLPRTIAVPQPVDESMNELLRQQVLLDVPPAYL